MSTLRSSIIKLAHSNPELRKDLLPLLSKEAVDEEAAKAAKRSVEMENTIRDALKAKGWKFTDGSTKGKVTEDTYEVEMHFSHDKSGGSIMLTLSPNDMG